MKKHVDEGIRAVREIRERISAEFENDPTKLVLHYIEQQKRHADRLLPSAAAEQEDPADDVAGRR